MDWRDLEDEIIQTIQKCCSKEEDVKAAKEYFKNISLNDLIDDALEE